MKKFLPREALKIIACLAMLIDHIGAALLPLEQALPLRMIGRIAFPIFCFLFAEGAVYTHSPLKYSLRLLVGMALAEIPFDLLFFEKMTWEHSSVMVTLFLGLMAILAVQKTDPTWLKCLASLPFILLGDMLHTDYGSLGVLLVLGMYLVRQSQYASLLRAVLLAAVCLAFNGSVVDLTVVRIPLQMFALLALVPIELYNGKRLTANKVAQWSFYLFYPLHIAVLLLITKLT